MNNKKYFEITQRLVTFDFSPSNSSGLLTLGVRHNNLTFLIFTLCQLKILISDQNVISILIRCGPVTTIITFNVLLSEFYYNRPPY